MVHIIPPKIKKFYDTWNIQSFVLLSLTMQTILILFAPFRKRTANNFVIFLIWTAYLIADWAAIFAVGLISNRQDGTPGNNQGTDEHADILAFWAPFLLLHLGGPDTISAFALEDNALWLRHLLGLLTQVFAAVIVFGQSLPDYNLSVPTVLIFVAGTIKYVERTCALYLANLNRFRESMLTSPDPGPDYARLIEECATKKDATLPTNIEMIREPNIEINKYKDEIYKVNVDLGDLGDLGDDIVVVQHAYRFFQIFKGLIVDLTFSFRERQMSRIFFQNIKSEDALKVIAVELNFIYEVLYTKVVVVRSYVGYVGRVISWICVVLALLIFYSRDKHHFYKIDVRITYILLFGAIGLDIIAFLMLVFSDWTAVSLKKCGEIFCIGPIAKGFSVLLRYFLNLKKINWSKSPDSTNFLEWTGQILFRRWSEYLHGYNFIDYCLKEYPKQSFYRLDIFIILRRIWIWVIKFLNLKDSYDKLIYKKKERISKELWEFIFTELKEKSKLVEDPETTKRICTARGDWVLQDTVISPKLMSYVADVDYDQSLMLWHIATELCLKMDTGYNYRNPFDSCKTCDKNHSRDGSCEICSREICKILSDYMLYLLVMQPTMMSAVSGIGQIIFRDTCAEAKRFFSGIDLGSQTVDLQAYKRLLDINTDVPPVAVKGARSKSVLFDACILAKELQKLDAENFKKKWMIMSKVWVELLSYAAGHCRANTHAAQLSEGGELITFVWLLMAHFGIGEQFQISEGHARANLIVGK